MKENVFVSGKRKNILFLNFNIDKISFPNNISIFVPLV